MIGVSVRTVDYLHVVCREAKAREGEERPTAQVGAEGSSPPAVYFYRTEYLGTAAGAGGSAGWSAWPCQSSVTWAWSGRLAPFRLPVPRKQI